MKDTRTLKNCVEGYLHWNIWCKVHISVGAITPFMAM